MAQPCTPSSTALGSGSSTPVWKAKCSSARPPATPADHPDIELLKHKSFVVAHHLPDATARQLNLAEYVPAVFRAQRPFADFLREAVEGLKR